VATAVSANRLRVDERRENGRGCAQGRNSDGGRGAEKQAQSRCRIDMQRFIGLVVSGHAMHDAMHAGMGGRARVARRVRIDRVLPPSGPHMYPAVAIHRCQRHCVLQEAIQCSCKAFLAEYSKPQVTAEVSWPALHALGA
jgi:hypothetical protein